MKKQSKKLPRLSAKSRASLNKKYCEIINSGSDILDKLEQLAEEESELEKECSYIPSEETILRETQEIKEKHIQEKIASGDYHSNIAKPHNLKICTIMINKDSYLLDI